MQATHRRTEPHTHRQAGASNTASPPLPQAHWVLESAQSRCVVVVEGDPISSGTGRLSFNKFNPETEKLQQEAEERQQRAAAAAVGESEGKAVSDEAMAAA